MAPGRSALAGAALSLTAGLFVLPSLYWGVEGTWELNRQFVDAVLHPGMHGGGNQERAEELTNINATDNQSFQATLHNYQYWGKLYLRPAQAQPWTRIVHWTISGVLTLAILMAAGWRRDDDPVRCLLFLGALFLMMTLATPVSHLHYFAKALPLVMGLLAVSRQGRGDTLMPRPAFFVLLVFAAVGYALPSIPVWEGRREAGLPAFVSLVLLAVTMGILWQQRRRLRVQEANDQTHACLITGTPLMGVPSARAETAGAGIHRS